MAPIAYFILPEPEQEQEIDSQATKQKFECMDRSKDGSVEV